MTCESCGQRPRAKTALGASLNRNLRVETRVEAKTLLQPEPWWLGSSNTQIAVSGHSTAEASTIRRVASTKGQSQCSGLARADLADTDTAGLTSTNRVELRCSAFR